MTRRIQFRVSGRVQRVAFRAHTVEAAKQHGCSGFVRNESDGAVTGEAQGGADALARFVEFLHEGSPWARVDHVQVAEIEASDESDGFVVER